MKKVFRLFWSYDVKKTEVWLSDMAQKGYLLEGLNRWTRCFFFRKGDSQNRTYRIGYDKMQGPSLVPSLVDEGWNKVVQSGNWYALSNEKPFEQIKSSPVRDGIIQRNRLIKYIYSAILMYFIVTNLMFFIVMSLTLFQVAPGEVVPSPMWILTISSFVLGISIPLYSIIKINKSNKYFISEKVNNIHEADDTQKSLSKDKEKQLKRAGKIIVKRKLGWMYSPDRLEQWLETMEERGYNLYRVSKTGNTFYFIKGSPRKVSYCADYQNFSDESYYDMHRESGWNSVFVSPWSIQKWTIWSQPYKDGEERPQIYSDKSNHLKHARRIAFSYSILFVPLIILYIWNFTIMVNAPFNDGTSKIDYLSKILILICIVGFGSFTVRIWLYYMRLRKRFNF